MEMRKSRVLEMLRSGKTVFSYKVNTTDPRVVEIAAMNGIPCIWTCVEHVANDWSVIEKQIYAAKAYNTDILVRVARGSYSDYIRPLELDASGIMVPHIMSAQDARNVVRVTRFYPIGRRPVDGGNADAKFGMIPQADYNRQANAERFVVVQIEDPEPLDELDEIASLDGIDMLFFGPGDFSHSIGVSGQLDHPEVNQVRRLIAETCRKHGKFAGTVATCGTARELVEMGYQFLNVGADVVAITEQTRQIGRFINDFS
ncbi:MAG: HpcH/HpaI aldolase family protein [Christensenellales bacterium]